MADVKHRTAGLKRFTDITFLRSMQSIVLSVFRRFAAKKNNSLDNIFKKSSVYRLDETIFASEKKLVSHKWLC